MQIHTRYTRALPGRLGAGQGCRRLAAAWHLVYILHILYNIFGSIFVLFGMITSQGRTIIF